MLPGGSPLFGLGTVAGCLGFVNAGFEIAEQVRSGSMPEPDYIFIAAGSTGSVTGLILGCKLAGLKTKVAAVQVSEGLVTNPASIERNVRNTLKMMRKADPIVPDISITYPDGFLFFDKYLGSAYGCMTRAGLDAVDTVARLEGDKGFHLETTYTGKACAAMFDFMKATPAGDGKTVLFWNTYNSRDLSDLARKSNYSYEKLPKAFHKFFNEKLACWQYKECPEEKRDKCKAYYGDDNRCWVVKELQGGDTAACADCDARKELEKRINVEKE